MYSQLIYVFLPLLLPLLLLTICRITIDTPVCEVDIVIPTKATAEVMKDLQQVADARR